MVDIIKYFSTPASFIPICVLLTLNITTSMTRFSQMYNSKVDIYKAEKRKTEKLLSSLLPTSVIRKLKKGIAGYFDFHMDMKFIYIFLQVKCLNRKCLRVCRSSSATS